MPELDARFLPWFLSAVSVTISLVATCHVILKKRETRAAIGWIGLIWLSPFLGTLLYVLFGINRISRKARSLRRSRPRFEPPACRECSPEMVRQALSPEGLHLIPLTRLVSKITPQPLFPGNRFTPLRNGDEAYPQMLKAIHDAERSVSLGTYIFNDDLAGQMFIQALGNAVERGVEVRVLVDDIGARYDLPRVFHALRKVGVTFASFLPSLAPGFMPYFNLRNHRKILVADGRTGFTGGMNIDKDYYHEFNTRSPKNDLHFRVEGPVVATLQHVFVEDWAFTTGESLKGRCLVPGDRGRGSDHRPRNRGRSRRGRRSPRYRDPRRALLRDEAGRHPHPVLRAGVAPDLRPGRHGASRDRGGHHPPQREQPEYGQVGRNHDARRTGLQRLPSLVHATPVRPHQADDRRRPLELHRLGELGRPQFPA